MATGSINVNIVTPLSGDVEIVHNDYTIEDIQKELEAGLLDMQATSCDEFEIFDEDKMQVAIITNPIHGEGYFVDFDIED